MDKVLVEVAGITGSAQYQGYVVILKEKDGKRILPIFIGTPEAHNINILLTGLHYIRPLTFDLFGNILDATGSKIEEVTVTKLEENTFFAEISLKMQEGNAKTIDARPSDAIALAIKADSPIYINSVVLDEAGFIGNVNMKIDDKRKEDMNSDSKISALLQQLNVAVEKEEYEFAAKIRDRIRELEQKDNPY